MGKIRKIAVLASGIIILGTTIASAMASTLADYPKPLFIKQSKFEGSIVVGDLAAAEDVIGAIDIATSLQYSATTTAGTDSVKTTVAKGEAAKIEGSKKLTLAANSDNLAEIKTTGFDDDDLPTILADGTYRSDDNRDYDFQQKIEFGANVQFRHYADSDYKDKEPNLMIYSARRNIFLTYKLDFVKAVESTDTSGTLDDIEDSSITMLGKSYEITNADISGTTITLDLMGGAIKDALEQGETKVYTLNGKDYEVTVTFIGSVGGSSKAKMVVNGELTNSLAEGDIHRLEDDTEISIKEILEEEAGEVTADIVEFYLGAEKLTITDPNYATTGYGSSDSENIKLNDDEVEDVYGDIQATMSSNTLKVDKIVLTWKPDEEIFIGEGEDSTFPGLGSFKVSYQGYKTGDTEEIRVEPSGSNQIELKVPLETGTVAFDLLNGSAGTYTSVGGEDYSLGTCNNAAGRIQYDMDTMEYFIATDENARESYLLEVTRIDNDDGITIRDVGGGTRYQGLTAGSHTVGEVTLTISNINETESNVTIVNSDTTYGCKWLFTKQGLGITMPLAVNAATYALTFTEEDKDENLHSGTAFTITLGWDSNQAQVTNIASAPFSGGGLFEDGSNDYVGYIASDLGTKVYWDKAGDDSAKITYHDTQSYAEAYISEVTTSFYIEGEETSTTSASVTKIERIEVGTAKLASEISDVKAQNLLIVGGPCANKAASDVMGFSEFPDADCAAGFEQGKAKIKLYNTGAGKIAMLVAGYSKEDTRKATNVVANYESYNLAGTEVEVTGTTDNPQVRQVS